MAIELARALVIAQALEALLARIDFGRLLPEHRSEIRRVLGEFVSEQITPAVTRQIGGTEGLDALLDEATDDLVSARGFFGLLQNDAVSDVLVNGPHQIYVEQQGQLTLTAFSFSGEPSLRRVALWLTSRVARPVTEQQPMIDARLPDGSRLNVIIPPLAVDGTVLSVRRFRQSGLDLEGLARIGSIPVAVVPLLQAMVASRLNILISGGTGSGKTTFLNALSEAIGERERVVTIEDAAELRLRQRHVVRLESRPPDANGKGEVTTRALVRNALRMRPDRILVGEVRGDEAIDMLQAMNTGHEGSMGTLHANSPRDALDRLESMVALGEAQVNDRLVRSTIARSVDVVIQVRRLADGRRALAQITEIGQVQGDVIATQDILRIAVAGEVGGSRAAGQFQATGIRPGFMDRIERRGFAISPDTWRIQQALP
jgi:pilus assembly protein CpaF